MTDYQNINPEDVDALRDLVADEGSEHDIETLEAVVDAWKERSGVGISRSALDPKNPETWRVRYIEDVPRLSRELDEEKAENERLTAELDELRATLEERQHAERQLTARIRSEIDQHLGFYTPRHIREQADGVFEERSSRGGRHARRRHRRGRRNHGQDTQD